MPEFRRHHLAFLSKRVKEERQFIQVLFGPRQVGKTTLVTQLLAQTKIPSLFLSADGVGAPNFSWIRQQWDLVRLEVQTKKLKQFIFVIDEIQKIDNWSEVVKQMWDQDTREGRPIKLILLGSSRLLLQDGLTESLAGRFETIYVEHWSYSEMAEAFGWDINQYIWFGGYPGANSLVRDEQRWKQYIADALIETSISKDILMLTRVDKPALMRRLFELGCAYSGQILSYTKMLGQLLDAGNTTTLAHYLQLLGGAGLISGLDKFSGDALRQRGSIPKFQVHNTALLSSRYPDTFKVVKKQPAIWGRFVESAIGAHLLNHSIAGGFILYYWRDGNNEVDFVIKKGNQIVALEVKGGLTQKAPGMQAFNKKYPQSKLILVGQGGLSVESFLKLNPIELFKW